MIIEYLLKKFIILTKWCVFGFFQHIYEDLVNYIYRITGLSNEKDVIQALENDKSIFNQTNNTIQTIENIRVCMENDNIKDARKIDNRFSKIKQIILILLTIMGIGVSLYLLINYEMNKKIHMLILSLFIVNLKTIFDFEFGMNNNNLFIQFSKLILLCSN